MLDGKPVKGKDSKDAAEQAYCNLRANGPTLTVVGHTVKEIVAKYLAYAKSDLRPASYRLREIYCLDFVKHFSDLTKVSGEELDEWWGKHEWVGTRHIAFQSIRCAFCFCAKQYKWGDNPFKGYKVPDAGDGKEIVYFTAEEEERLLANASPAMKNLLTAMFNTGCRPGEASNLRRRHVKAVAGGMAWVFPAAEHKTGKKTKKPRVIRVGKSVEALVCQAGDVVFPDSNGRAYTPITLGAEFVRLRKKCGLTYSIYACRHTFAKRMLPVMGVEALASQMGNSAEVCKKYYCEGWADVPENTAAVWAGLV
jgi:integrase